AHPHAPASSRNRPSLVNSLQQVSLARTEQGVRRYSDPQSDCVLLLQLCGLSVSPSLLISGIYIADITVASPPRYGSIGHQTLEGEAHTSFRHSQRPRETAASIPTSWAMMNAATPGGDIPAKVFESNRAMVTAGFANDVEDVNQYAAVI